MFLHRLKLYVYFFLDVADSYILISTGFVQLATIENTQLDKYVITTIYRIYACKKKTTTLLIIYNIMPVWFMMFNATFNNISVIL